MIPAAAALTGVALIFAAAYAGGRTFRQTPDLPVAATFRAVGVAAVPPDIDVLSHRRLPGGHRGEGRATRGDARRRFVPNGIHRSSAAWAELNEQRARFAALVRGGAR